jgi:predicted chitinase
MLERQMTAVGITDPKERAMMLAQIDHESGFRARSENLNYSSVDRIRSVFGKNKGISGMSDEEVAKLVNNPEALANVVYADKNRSSKSKMGNTEEGDGYKYRGRGMIQLTGKANYEKYGKLLGIDLVNNPDLANDPAIAAQLATAYWKENNLGKAAREGDVTAVTQKINGGQNGAADREAKYAKYLREGQRSDTANTSIAASPDTTTVKTSVAPGVEGYDRAASVTPEANVSIASNAPTPRSEQGANASVEHRQVTAASDVPLVLGDNHMIVINAGMMGA